MKCTVKKQEKKIPVFNSDVPISGGFSEDIPPPKPIPFRVAIYKPTRMKKFDRYQYEFDRIEER